MGECPWLGVCNVGVPVRSPLGWGLWLRVPNWESLFGVPLKCPLGQGSFWGGSLVGGSSQVVGGVPSWVWGGPRWGLLALGSLVGRGPS